MAVMVFFSTFVYVRNVPLGQPPDEWAQLSYIADITSGGPPIPDYADSIILDSGQQNYLSHPPLYYTTLGLVGKALSWEPQKDYQRYRYASALLVAAGVFLWVLIAGRLGLPPTQAAGLGAATLAIPMFPYLAGSVNNDNLCYLGVAIFFYGFVSLPARVKIGAYVCALGMSVVLLTKATGAVFLLTFAGVWTVLASSDARALGKNRHVRIAATVTAIVCAAYFLPTWLAYHRLFPAPGTIYGGHVAPAEPTGFMTYVGAFSHLMLARLPAIMSANAFFPVPAGMIPLFYAMLGAPLLAWIAYRPFSPANPNRRMADAFMTALLVTLCVHLWVTWQGYLQTGLYAGLQPRYYAYALPGIFLFAFLDGCHTRLKRGLFLVFGTLALVFVAMVPPRAALAIVNQQRAAHAAHLGATNLYSAHPGWLPNAPTTAAGYLDHVRIENGRARLTGWAIDAIDKHPTRALWVSLRGRLIGTAQPMTTRPDVASALQSPQSLRSGFQITVSHVPADISACDVSVQAEQDNGTLATLPNSTCIRLRTKPPPAATTTDPPPR
ncbi:hypothetical protein RLIN73S_02557 [Rhodanobacter lindaniclasticus]